MIGTRAGNEFISGFFIEDSQTDFDVWSRKKQFLMTSYFAQTDVKNCKFSSTKSSCVRKRAAIFLFSIAKSIAPFFLYAQSSNYHVQFFDEASGINAGAFQKIDMTKDKDNFLWILQSTKVQRYDGKNAVDFIFKENLVSVFCDTRGIIWVTSDTKAYKFLNDRKKFEQVSLLDERQISLGRVFQLKDKPVWLQTSVGFFEYDRQQKSFKKVLVDVPATNNITRRNFAFFRSVLFFQNEDSLYSYNLSTKQIKTLSWKPGVDLFPVSETRLLSTSWEYISYWLDFEKKQVNPAMSPEQKQSASPSFIYVRDLKQLDENRFIIGARNGIFEYDLKEDRYKKLNFYHAGKLMTNSYTIVRIYIDTEKKIWLGFRDGIAHYDHFRDVIALKRNNEPDKINTWTDAVTNFAEDEKGNIWFAGGNGFAFWDLDSDIITSFPAVQGATDRLSQLSVRGIVYDGRYIILGPTDKGFWLFDPIHQTYKRPRYPAGEEGMKVKQLSEGDFVDQIRTLHNGDHMVVGRDALYRLNGKTYELTIFDCQAGKENANFVRQDLQKRIWIGTNKGLHCFDPGLNYLFKVNDLLKDITLRSFCVWNNDEMLVSGRGIYSVKIENNKIYTSRVHPFFNDINVTLMYKDHIGKLWAGTDQGLYRIDSATREIELFDYADNVQGNGFNYDAAFVNSKNILFLGGVNGINYFIPEKIPPLNHLLNVSIQKVRVNEDDSSYISKASAFSLKYNQRSMEVSFVAPYYFNANKVKYRYMLEGFASEWKNIGSNNSVLFTSLPSGNYVFRVGASMDETHWHESRETIKFSIQLPFWKTWWFISLSAVVAGALLYILYKYQVNKKLEVERFRLRVSRDLHDDIGSTLSSINILCKSSLSNEPEKDNNMILLQKIQQRSQKTLDAMDDLVWSTKPGNDSLDSLIVRMREYAAEVLEAAGISFSLESPGAINSVKLNMQQRKNLYLIFKEAVNNLAKYSKTKKASISFEQQKKYLRMNIIDEGTGFTITSIKRGNGLDNMQSRAAEMNAQLKIRSGENKGTTISLDMPV